MRSPGSNDDADDADEFPLDEVENGKNPGKPDVAAGVLLVGAGGAAPVLGSGAGVGSGTSSASAEAAPRSPQINAAITVVGPSLAAPRFAICLSRPIGP